MAEMVKLHGEDLAYVILGSATLPAEYANHPNVKSVDAKSVPAALLADTILFARTKAILLTDGVPRDHYMFITTQCQKRKIPFLIRKSNQAVYQTLLEMCPKTQPVTQDEAKETQSKGKLKSLIPYIDWNKSNSENARILMDKAVELGVRTTMGSLSQLVSIERRKQGRSDVPKSVRSKLDVTVELFDKFIEELGAMRDYIIEVVDENRTLKLKLDKYDKALEALREGKI